jgi:RNA polymerase sigma-70 factor (ECF subfamily)
VISDSDIVAAVRAGERDAVLARLVPQFRRRVYSLAWSIVKDSAAAEDVAQDVFVRVWRALPSYDGRAKFSTWIYAITRNAAISARRRQRPALSLSDAATFAEVEAVTGDEAPAIQDVAEERAVAAAIAALPERQQQVVTLFYMQDRSCEEVAEMLAMPLGTVKTLLHRARGRLEQQLGGERAGAAP